MKKGIILTIACLTLVCGCGKVPKLKNGEEAVITFAKDKEEHNISAEDLYQELKENMGLQAVIKMIDKYVFEKEFEDYLDDARKEAKEEIKKYEDMFGGEDAFLKMLQNSTNYSSIQAYEDALYSSMLEKHATDEYAKTLVTDKDIQKYYDDTVKGDVEIYHILVTPKVQDEMTDEEKAKKEDEAKKVINTIIKTLDESKDKDKLETFKKLVKEYSNDESSKAKDGNLGYINYGDLDGNYDELIKSAFSLKNGEYSKSLITTELGYHVIYRTNQKEKDALKDIKDEIIKTLAEEKKSEDKNISVNALKYYRKLYNLEIHDDELNRQYGIYLNSLINKK